MNNPASAEGFTVIFNKARDEKKTSGTAANMVSPRRNVSPQRNNSTYNKNEKRQQSSKVELTPAAVESLIAKFSFCDAKNC